MRFKRCLFLLTLALGLMASVMPALAQEVTISITPDTIPLESPFEISINGLEGGSSYTITLIFVDTGAIVYSTDETASDDGQILMFMASEPDDATGVYEITVSDGEQMIASGQFTLVDDGPDADSLADLPQRNTSNVTIMPPSGPIGSTHDLFITGLDVGQAVTIQIVQADSGEIVYERTRSADGIGQVQIELFSSGDDAPGTYIVVVRDDSGQAIGRGEFIVEAPPVIDAQLRVLPASAAAGSNFYINIAQITPFTNLQVIITDDNESILMSRMVRADAGGDAMVEYQSEADTALGSYTITALLNDVEVGSAVLTITDGEVQTAHVLVTPDSGAIGTMHDINVVGLEPESTFQLEVVAPADTVVYTTERSADDNGHFFMNIASEAGDAPGLYAINIIQDGVVMASGSFTIEDDAETAQVPDEQPAAETTPEPEAETTPEPDSSAVIDITPASGPRGTSHSITAAGLEPYALYTISVTLGENSIYSAERSADSSGQIVLDIRSDDADTLGVYTVSIAQGETTLAETTLTINRTSSADSATADAPSLTIAPAAAPQGSAHTITVSGLTPDSMISLNITLDDALIYSTERTADANGEVVIFLRSEDSDVPGEYSVKAQQDGVLIAEGTLTIEASSTAAPPATDEPEADSPEAASITIDPTQGPIGTSHAITITGLEADSSVQIDVSYDGAVVYSTERSASADGIISLTLASEPGDPAGTYTVTVSRDGMALASAEMMVEAAEAAPPDAAEDAPSAGAEGEVLLDEDGTLTTDAAEMRYSFQGQAGDVVSIITSSADFDTLVILEAADGEQVARNDDYEGLRDARIVDFTLPESGTYSVIVTSFDYEVLGEATTGSFSLMVTRQTQTAVTPTESSVELELLGDPFGGSQRVTATGLQPGQSVTFALIFYGEQVVVTEELADEDGTAVAILRTAEGDGIYEVIVSANGQQVASARFLLDGGVSTRLPDEDQQEVQPTDEDTLLYVEGELFINMQMEMYSLMQTHEFRGEMGETVSITLNSSDFDPLVILLDENGDELVRDDDSGGDLNAAISRYTLPYSGTYYVLVTSYERVESGFFELTVRRTDQMPALSTAVTIAPASGPPGTLYNVVVTGLQPGQMITANVIYAEEIIFTSDKSADDSGIVEIQLVSDEDDAEGLYTVEIVSDGTTIATGQFSVSTDGTTEAPGSLLTVSDSLTQTNLSRAYSFAGETGQIIEISLESEAFDTVVTLQDNDGNELVRDDDGGISLNSFIAAQALPYTGTYTVVVMSYSESSTGPFTLHVSNAQIDELNYNALSSGTFTSQNWSDVYVFDGDADALVVFDVQAVDDSSMNLSLMDADSGAHIIESISPMLPVRLPEDGRYLVQIDSYDVREEMTGSIAYSLSVLQVEAETLALNTPVSATFSLDESYEYFLLEGTAGDQFSLSVTGDSQLDTTLTLIAPDNHTEFFDDDSGPAYHPEINNHVLSQSGTYVLVLQTYSSGDSGTVTLELSGISAQTLTTAVQRVHLNSKNPSAGFSMDGRSGEAITLSISRASGMPVDLHITVMQGDETIMAYQATGSPDMFSLSFRVSEDGPITVSLQDTGYGNSTLEISAQHD